jgi:prepilin-type N-terminal cleavage/methylation domain-containing protein
MMKVDGKILNLDRRGMTLVEMMISLAIFTVVLGVVFGFLQNTSESYQKTRQKVQYQQSVRAAISLMSSEIRSTGCDPGSVGFDKFGQADSDLLQCRMDLNGDSDTTDNNPDEDITYSFAAATGELTRDVGNGPQVILRGLQNVTFSYFDGTGTALPGVPLNAVDRSLVRFVDLIMTGETDQGEPVTFTTRVAIRNG